MDIQAFQTSPIVVGDSLFPLLDRYIDDLKDGDVIAVTSKVVSICEGRVQKLTNQIEKDLLIRNESERYLDTDLTRRYGFQMTIAHNILISNAGIDHSNGNGYAVLWPEDPMKSAEKIWKHLKAKRSLSHLGVIITDSHTTLLRRGTIGIGLAWCGFVALKNYIGTKDIFGREFLVTQSHMLDGLAAAAVVVMGEGNEQTPFARIRGVQGMTFTNCPPTEKEKDAMRIGLEEDMYAPLLLSVPWQKGGKS